MISSNLPGIDDMKIFESRLPIIFQSAIIIFIQLDRYDYESHISKSINNFFNKSWFEVIRYYFVEKLFVIWQLDLVDSWCEVKSNRVLDEYLREGTIKIS